MQSKVCYYNEFTHIIVVNYKGIRIQFMTNDYKGEQTVNVLRSEKGYFISNGSAKKVVRNNTKKGKKEQSDISAATTEETDSEDNSGLT
jgi:uncharacterized protein YqfB (UPF0267 family)